MYIRCCILVPITDMDRVRLPRQPGYLYSLSHINPRLAMQLWRRMKFPCNRLSWANWDRNTCRRHIKKMSGFGVILFGLSCILFPCNGGINPPPNGTKLTLLKGSTAMIQWSYDGASGIKARIWSFTSSDGSPEEGIAEIFLNNPPEILNSSLPRVSLKTPATLILHNVTEKYDGTYKFALGARVGGGISEVVVYIAAKPNVTVNCSSLILVKEGNDVICECKCEGGNPPAECTWYKMGAQIGERKMELNKLFIRNFNGKDRGSYTCVGQSHVKATDERSIRVTDIFKPVYTAIEFSTKSFEIGESVTIMCSSDGFPEPRFTIFHNHTRVVSTEKTYTICKVNWSDGGTYKCFARNEFGYDATFANFTVKESQEPRRSSVNTNITSPTLKLTTRNGSERKASEDLESCITEWWYIIAISSVSGVIIGILLSYAFSYARRKWFTRPERSHAEGQKTASDSTYQELDLTKINKEDNYQSLKGNVARNDGVNEDESNYTELNKVRDVESNYQSLT